MIPYVGVQVEKALLPKHVNLTDFRRDAYVYVIRFAMRAFSLQTNETRTTNEAADGNTLAHVDISEKEMGSSMAQVRK